MASVIITVKEIIFPFVNSDLLTTEFL